MAKDKENQDGQAAAEQPAEKPDLVTQIGTLTYGRAVKNFGKEKALEVLHKVAEIGGHGLFDDRDFLSPLFGGLQMPSPDVVIAPDKAYFANLPEGDFQYSEAMDKYHELQATAAENRSKINDLFIAYQGMAAS